MMLIRSLLMAGAACMALASAASANIILQGGSPTASFTDLGAQGFGNAPRMLTEQTNTFESGSVTPVDVVHGDAVPGANKSTTPTLGTLGWGSGIDVGIGFNSDQTGNSGITLQTLVLTIYNGTTPIGSFSLASPVNFSSTDLALQQGNGNAVFSFILDAAQQAQFNTIAAMPGSSGFFAGLNSSLGCNTTPSATCQVSNDGPDSFLGFRAVPAPLVGAGLPTLLAATFGLAGLQWRRRRRVAA
jgi:hypothetical protein